MKLQILIPQYDETETILASMLGSILMQQNVDLKHDVGVIIANDGSDVKLSKSFLKTFPYKIDYLEFDHRGVSATRNGLLDASSADYVMFCDADDMFVDARAFYIIFREISAGGFDVLVSKFSEESRDPKTKEVVYVDHDMDTTFVHGKVYNRLYLLRNRIRWNDKLTIHEDSYFNCLAQRLSVNGKYCPFPFYLWKWRDASVCRHDPKYILKTYNNMLDSNTALITEFMARGRKEDAQFYCTSMIFDAYFTMNKDEWLNQENGEYRLNTEKRFKEYFEQFESLFDQIKKEVKAQIIMGIKNRMFQEGLFMESVTFDDWIKHIKSLQ